MSDKLRDEGTVVESVAVGGGAFLSDFVQVGNMSRVSLLAALFSLSS